MKNRIWMTLGLALTAWGAWSLIDNLPQHEKKPMPVSDLEAGIVPAGRWLELTGRVLGKERIIWPLEGPKATYVPLVSEAWQAGSPIAVFVRAKEKNPGEPGRLTNHEEPTITGLVDPQGLPADVRALFVQVELPPTQNALVLDYRADPLDLLFLSWTAFLVGLLIIFLTGLRAGFFSFRKTADPKETGP